MKKQEPTIVLMRHMLGSISLDDVEDYEEMSEGERKEYCAAISAVFPRLEKDIKRFLYAQLMFSANEADTWEKVIFGRGIFNGLELLLEYWKVAHLEHSAKSVSKEEFEKSSPVGEI